jgi:hypothetical protein
VRFDAYAGNVWGGTTASEVAELVAHGTGGRVARGRPRGRYTDCFEVSDGADPIGWVGFDRTLETAYFECKGTATPDASGVIRRHWPERHSVSRLDACEDYDELGAFDKIVRIVDAARDPRVKSRAWQPRNNDETEGATIYWGSASSRVMVRCYEAGKMAERRHLGRPYWARAEAQIRPAKAAEKKVAASISPLDAWGFAGWARRAAEALCQVDVPRLERQDTPSTFDRTTLYVARAYRRHWEQMLLDFGSWECVGRELQAVWRQDDDAAEALRVRQGSRGGTPRA